MGGFGAEAQEAASGMAVKYNAVCLGLTASGNLHTRQHVPVC